MIRTLDIRCTHRPRVAAALLAAALAGCGGGGGGDAGVAQLPGAASAWGEVALGGSQFAAVAAAVPRIVPNTVPQHTVGDAGLQRLDWVMDGAYDARAQLAPARPQARVNVSVVSDSGASGAFVGELTLAIDVDAGTADARSASFVAHCGGASPSGLFAALPRDAGCEAIVLDWTHHELRFNAAALTGGAATLNGRLAFIDHDPQAATTASAPALRACPLTPGGAAAALPAAAGAACLAGAYHGVSDTGGACSVVIDTAGAAPQVQVAVDGYARSYAHFARMQGGLRDGSGINETHWTYWFTALPTDGSDPADLSNPAGASEFVMADFGNLAVFAAADGPVQAVSFAVAHVTAPAGVAGPVDVKFCHVALPR
jgi:hypothetical protein